MISLLLDSSNRDLSLAIATESTIIDYISYEAWQRQSELMIPELQKLLGRNNLTREAISDVCVAIGPGSYTGVRIALTIAKVIAFSLNIPLYSCSSLHIKKIANRETIALINARSNRSYIGVYCGEKVLLEDCIMSNEDVLKFCQEHPAYLLSGELEYLGLSGQSSKTLENMLELKKYSSKCSPLDLKPKYLKDEL